MKRVFLFCVMMIMLFSVTTKSCAAGLYPEKKEHYTIVIDPGHGGDNWGTTSNVNFMEKEITMKTALAIVEELKQYDNVTVYLTHEEDVGVSLKNRAVFAKEKNADFLFSIHYNASENHTMYGTEVWIPLEAPFHSYGYKFAYLQQLEMQELGLFSRGIRSRRNEEGTDYYGIIRECVARDIPAVIIEHCYIDEERDASYCDEDADYIEFGRRDAIAIAKYLGLIETDGELETLAQIEVNDTIPYTYEDPSAPEICEIYIEKVDSSKNELTVKVNAMDSDTPLMYYDYSLDGGDSFSKLFTWSNSDVLQNTYDKSFSLTIPVENWEEAQLVLRVYNKFDLYKGSNVITNVEITRAKADAEAGNSEDKSALSDKEETAKEVPAVSDIEGSDSLSMKRFGLLFIFVILWLLLLFVVVRAIYSITKKK